MNDKLGVKDKIVSVRLRDRKNPDIVVERKLRFDIDELIELERTHKIRLRSWILRGLRDDAVMQDLFGFAELTTIIWVGRQGWLDSRGKERRRLRFDEIKRLIKPELYEEYLLTLLPVLARGVGFNWTEEGEEDEEGGADALDPTESQKEEKSVD